MSAAERTIQRVNEPVVEWAVAHDNAPIPPLVVGTRVPPAATATERIDEFAQVG